LVFFDFMATSLSNCTSNPFESLAGFEKYSFLKTPRWKENAMEVGTLARLIVSFAAGHADVKETVGMVLGKLNVPVDALFSTLGRTAARGIDAALAMTWLKDFFGQLMERVKTREVSVKRVRLRSPACEPARFLHLSFSGGEGFWGNDVMADVVIGGYDVSAEECDAELNEAGAVGFSAVGDGADDGAGAGAHFVEHLGDAVLSGDGEVLFAA
jgi:hypothetical protein